MSQEIKSNEPIQLLISEAKELIKTEMESAKCQQTDQALILMCQALQIQIDYEVYVLMGQIYKKKGEHRKARSYTVKAYELRPDLEEISKQLISLDIKLGYYDEALFLLSQIPLSATMFQQISQCYLGLGQFGVALSYANKAIRLYRNDTTHYVNKAMIYASQHHLGLIHFYFNLALQLDPNDDQVYTQYAQALIEQEEYQLGLEAINNSIRLLQKADYYANQGVVYQLLNDRQKAMDSFKQALELDPCNQKAFYRYSFLIFQLPTMDYNQQMEVQSFRVQHINPFKQSQEQYKLEYYESILYVFSNFFLSYHTSNKKIKQISVIERQRNYFFNITDNLTCFMITPWIPIACFLDQIEIIIDQLNGTPFSKDLIVEKCTKFVDGYFRKGEKQNFKFNSGLALEMINRSKDIEAIQNDFEVGFSYGQLRQYSIFQAPAAMKGLADGVQLIMDVLTKPSKLSFKGNFIFSN